MPIKTWTDALALGIDPIDDEHRKLFAMLDEAMRRDGETLSAAEAGAAVDRLIAFAAEHFRHEEEVMARIGYPETDRHRRAHVKLREQAKFLKTMLEDQGDPVQVRVETAGFLSDWLASHLAGMDMELRPYIARHIALHGPL
jgi:hemerythrin-like metal-binding protein